MWRADREVSHNSLVEHLYASVTILLEQVVFEPSSIQLK